MAKSHVVDIGEVSVELGQVICQDDAAAADRDVAMTTALQRRISTEKPQSPVHPLRSGIRYARGVALAGTLMLQARVSCGPTTGLFDEVVGTGFVLLSEQEGASWLNEETRCRLAELDVRVVTVVPPNTPAPASTDVVDEEGFYLPYLAAAGARGVLVRPDFYVFGQLGEPADYPGMVADLRVQLALRAPVT